MPRDDPHQAPRLLVYKLMYFSSKYSFHQWSSKDYFFSEYSLWGGRIHFFLGKRDQAARATSSHFRRALSIRWIESISCLSDARKVDVASSKSVLLHTLNDKHEYRVGQGSYHPPQPNRRSTKTYPSSKSSIKYRGFFEPSATT